MSKQFVEVGTLADDDEMCVRRLTARDTLECGAVLPGFKLALSTLFKDSA